MKSEFEVGDKIICVDATHQGECLTKGNIYTVSSFRSYDDNRVAVINDNNREQFFYVTRFEREVKSLPTDIQGQIDLAKSYIGKEVTWKTGSYGGRFKVTNINVYADPNIELPSLSSDRAFKRDGFSVVVNDKKSFMSVLDVTPVKIKEFESVKLNSEYTDTVYKDKVIVGCQTIPMSAIDEIVDAVVKLKNQ